MGKFSDTGFLARLPLPTFPRDANTLILVIESSRAENGSDVDIDSDTVLILAQMYRRYFETAGMPFIQTHWNRHIIFQAAPSPKGDGPNRLIGEAGYHVFHRGKHGYHVTPDRAVLVRTMDHTGQYHPLANTVRRYCLLPFSSESYVIQKVAGEPRQIPWDRSTPLPLEAIVPHVSGTAPRSTPVPVDDYVTQFFAGYAADRPERLRGHSDNLILAIKSATNAATEVHFLESMYVRYFKLAGMPYRSFFYKGVMIFEIGPSESGNSPLKLLSDEAGWHEFHRGYGDPSKDDPYGTVLVQTYDHLYRGFPQRARVRQYCWETSKSQNFVRHWDGRGNVELPWEMGQPFELERVLPCRPAQPPTASTAFTASTPPAPPTPRLIDQHPPLDHKLAEILWDAQQVPWGQAARFADAFRGIPGAFPTQGFRARGEWVTSDQHLKAVDAIWKKVEGIKEVMAEMARGAAR